MQKFKCQDCESIIEEDDLATFEQEHEAWGHPVYERFSVCPYCHGSVFDYDEPEEDEEDEEEECE